jgi:hypothetical protein
MPGVGFRHALRSPPWPATEIPISQVCTTGVRKTYGELVRRREANLNRPIAVKRTIAEANPGLTQAIFEAFAQAETT